MEKYRKVLKITAITFLTVLLLAVVIYTGGVAAQFHDNYTAYMEKGGFMNQEIKIEVPRFNFDSAFSAAFTPSGIKSVGIIIVLMAAGVLFLYMYIRKENKNYDERGFKISSDGSYGTAGWMNEKEMRSILEVSSVQTAEGTILGEHHAKAVCMPKDTYLNRHIAVFGASGTMKSRAVIRPALFQILKRNESVIITDPKGELYSDTAKLYKDNGYDVKVFNLVDPAHSDSWNCLEDVGNDTLLAQVLTNVIIGNTSSGRGDRFWDNGEGNLLKALILLVSEGGETAKMDYGISLASVYDTLINFGVTGLANAFEASEASKESKLPYKLFAQANDNVKAGVVSGLGTRLQVLQNEAVCRLVCRNDIDLVEPARKKCAYYVITSDQDSTMTFLSSLFFSLLFIKLTRYADSQANGKCPVPVNLILDEFNNIGRIGGAQDGSDFAKTLSVIRSRDVRIMLAVQSLGQLQNRYPNNLWAEIIGNCDIQLMLGCTDDLTAEYFSERGGDITIEVDSTKRERRTIALYEMIPKYQETTGMTRRKLMNSDEILRMPHDEMLAIIRGQNVLRLKKLDYTKHPFSKNIKRISLSDYIPKPMEVYVPRDLQTVASEKSERPPAKKKVALGLSGKYMEYTP